MSRSDLPLKYIKNVDIIVLELVQVGNDSGKRMAYESGLVRSDLSKDNYHKLLCKQSIMLGHGKFLCCNTRWLSPLLFLVE